VTYTVELIQVVHRKVTIKVRADDEDEAKDVAMDRFFDNKIRGWKDSFVAVETGMIEEVAKS
jgi:hypothetical protein